MINKGKVLTAAISAVGAVTGVVGAVEAVETVVEKYEYNNVHEIVVYDTYKINGQEVDPDDWNSYLEQAGVSETIIIKDPTSKKTVETSTISITDDDFDTDGIARLSEYIDFEFSGEEVCGAKVCSDEVVKITYEYSNDYLSFFQNNKYESYGLECVVYQDTSRTDGMIFTIGKPVENGYELVTEVTPENNYYIFKLVDNPDFAKLTFSQIFKSITIEVTK